MADTIPLIELNDGKKIPQLGHGTWQSTDEETRNAVFEAINIGYRHIDSAWVYGNEDAVGAAIHEHIEKKNVTREELFITSKLWSTYHDPARVREGLKSSLQQLGLDYVDLYLIHTPMALKWVNDGKEILPKDAQGKLLCEKSDHLGIWRELERARDDGLIRSIGLSSFDEGQITNILDHCGVKPVTNQVECNLYRQQNTMRNFLNEHNMKLTAYAPIGSPGSIFRTQNDQSLLDDTVVCETASKIHCSPGQLCLNWLVRMGDIVIPKSVNASNIGMNMQCFDIKLDMVDQENLLSLQGASGGGPQFRFEEWQGAPDFPKFS